MKRPRGGSLFLVLTPDELLARLATLVPPPRVHGVRYHGPLRAAAPHPGEAPLQVRRDHPHSREAGGAYDKAGYGSGLLAHLAVAKCADAIPIYRLAKQYRRSGVPVSRSSLNDLFHRTAEETAPLAQRLLASTPSSPPAR